MIGKKPLPVDPNIRKRADEMLRRSGYPRLPNGLGIDVQAIIENYCKFKFAVIPQLELGGKRRLAAYIPEHNYVLVEQNCPEPRQRFSMAHELGHAELEHDFGPAQSLFGDQGSSAFLCGEDEFGAVQTNERRLGLRRRSEIRANQFAAFLLMPEALVRDVWRSQKDVRACAAALVVSSESLRYRLSDLGLSER